MANRISRRDAILAGVGGAVVNAVAESRAVGEPPSPEAAPPFLTPANDFNDVSRGTPLPHSLTGQALIDARLTVETWKLKIVAEDKAVLAKPRTIAAGTALDYAGLLALGKAKSVRFLKAMQCNNIPRPLGQGLWEGVLLRDVLETCGQLDEVRRLFYWGFHNGDPKQIFRSSLAFNQVLDSPPGEMPPFLAYKLNGEALSLERGGPVRMIVPWAHGFKSVKWLQKIVLTNKSEANDTYAEAGNDPESYLKTAAYFAESGNGKFPSGKPMVVRGTAMVGWPGLERVEYWLRPDTGQDGKLSRRDPAWATADWKPVTLDPAPKDWVAQLPGGVPPKDVWGFTPEGKPKEWPMRFSVANWSLELEGLKAGKYELRVRSVDKNGFAQPEPRDGPRSGKNAVPFKLIEVA